MAITTGSHPKALWPGVKAYFGKTYTEKPLVADMVFDKSGELDELIEYCAQIERCPPTSHN